MTKTFSEVIAGIRAAKKGVEVREDLAQMGEYCQQFTTEAGQRADAARDAAQGYAANAEKSQQKAAQTVQGIDQTKADTIAAVQQAQAIATQAVEDKQTAAESAVDQAKTGAVQEVDDAKNAALQEVAASTEDATNAAKAANASKEAAAGSASAALNAAGASADAAAAASGSASAAATSESNAATSASNASTDADRAEAAAQKAEATVSADKTLTIPGAPADAAAVGEALEKKADAQTTEDALGKRYTKEEVDDKLGEKLDLSGGTMTAPLILPGGLTALGYADNAGNRNAMPPRDRSLGTPTSEHFEMIANGKYNELFLGDYWTVGGVDYLIADFNYWYNCGDTACTKNHVLVVPRNNMYTASMNSTNVTTGGYVGSAMHKTGLAQAKSAFNAAFGSAHILNHREYLVNAVTNGKPTGTDWYDSTVELMNENMVYGGRQFSPMPDGNSDPWNTCRNYTIDKSQLSLFRYEPWLICNRNWYWLRDVVSAATFTYVFGYGYADCNNASYASGVRPVAGIC